MDRGARPPVRRSGEANAFNFVPFAGTGASCSFPSAACITAFALAFAVRSVWPRLRFVMFVYAVRSPGPGFFACPIARATWLRAL